MSNTDNYNNQIEEDSVHEDQTHCEMQAGRVDEAARGKLKDISEDFKNREFDPEQGVFIDDDTPCCVGERLARLLLDSHLLEGRRLGFYRKGISALQDLLGIKRGELTLTLWALGASSQPFGAKPWSVHPSVVFDKLSKIENIKEFLKDVKCLISRSGFINPLEFHKNGNFEWEEK